MPCGWWLLLTTDDRPPCGRLFYAGRAIRCLGSCLHRPYALEAASRFVHEITLDAAMTSSSAWLRDVVPCGWQLVLTTDYGLQTTMRSRYQVQCEASYPVQCPLQGHWTGFTAAHGVVPAQKQPWAAISTTIHHKSGGTPIESQECLLWVGSPLSRIYKIRCKRKRDT